MKAIWTAVQTKIAHRAIQKNQDYVSTFRTPHGSRVLHDLISNHHVLGPVFSTDPLEMARKEGERNVVLRILTELNVDQTRLQNLIRENSDVSISQMEREAQV